jgi:hypothetical protein
VKSCGEVLFLSLNNVEAGDMVKTVLVLAANPIESPRFQFNHEMSAIQRSLERSTLCDTFKVEFEPAADWDRLRQRLLDCKPEIVHFVGHGNGLAGLVLEGLGTQEVVQGRRFAQLLMEFPMVRCVLLNACHSKVQATEIFEQVQQVRYVMGMKQTIAQESSRQFAIAFYDGVFAGLDYGAAFRLGKTGIKSSFDDYKPHLFARDVGDVVVNAIDLEPPGSRMSIDTLESFVGSLNWVKKHSRSLYGLSPSHQGQLVGAIKQARREPRLDFHPLEIDVLELASHYVFYCLQDRSSPTFRKMQKKEYVRKLTEFSQNGQQIRVGKEKLSILVRESENRLNVKEDFSKVIEKLEFHNES